MLFDEQFHFWRFVIRGVVNKQDNSFDTVSMCICNNIAQMYSEFDVPSPGEGVPYNVFMWPK